jgi:hypothetical protein
MSWADYEPDENWHDPYAVEVTPVDDSKRRKKAAAAEAERQRRRKAKREEAEVARKARLDRLKRMTAESATASRWIWSPEEKRYAWHQYDPLRQTFFDSGARLTSRGVEYPEGWIFPER